MKNVISRIQTLVVALLVAVAGSSLAVVTPALAAAPPAQFTIAPVANGGFDTTVPGAGISCVSSSWCMIGTTGGKYETWTPISISASTLFASGRVIPYCFSTTSCYAIDASSNFYKWNGTSWTNSGATGGGIWSLRCVSTSFCIAGGTGGVFTYNGSSWTKAYSYSDSRGYNTIFSADCATATFCVASAQSGDEITFNGTTWSKTTKESLSLYFPLAQVTCFTSPSNGCYIFGQAQNNIWMKWNGSSWSTMSGAPTNAMAVDCVSATNCLTSPFARPVTAVSWLDGSSFVSSTLKRQAMEVVAVSCVSTTWCAGVDEWGQVIYPNLGDAPSGLAAPSAAISGPLSITVTMPVPTNDGGQAITSYTATATGGATCTSATNVCTFTGLTANTSYNFTYKASNIIGASSASAGSTALRAANVPSTPATPTARWDGNSGNMTVQYRSVAGNGASVTGYTVTATPGGYTCVANATTCVFKDLPSGNTYTFTVFATNAAGNGTASGSSDSVVVPGAPSKIAKPTVTSGGSGRADVTWTAPSENGSAITGYTVTANNGGGTCTSTSATHCAVSGLTPGTAYTFTVTATNSAGTSPASDSSDVFYVLGGPAAPGPASAVVYGAGRIAVSWTAPSSDGGSAITGYTVTSSPASTTCRTTTALTCNFTGLTVGQSYTFAVVANTALGSSAPSSSSSIYAAQAPATPVFSSIEKGDHSLTFNIAEPTTSETGYSPVTQYTVNLGGGVTCTTTSRSCTVTGLTLGSNHTAKVQATNAAGSSAWSALSSSVSIIGVASAVRNVSAVPAGFIRSGGSRSMLRVFFDAPATLNGSIVSSYTVTVTPGDFTCTVNVGSPLTCDIKGALNAGYYDGLTVGSTYGVSVVANTNVGSSDPATSSVTLTTTPSAASVSISNAYAANYYMAKTATTTISFSCSQYWGATGGTFSASIAGSTSYPAAATYSGSNSVSSAGCTDGGTVSFSLANLPNWGTYTATVTATSANGKATTSTVTFVTDGVLGTPKMVTSYTASTQKLSITVTAAVSNTNTRLQLTDGQGNTCSSASSATLSCIFSNVSAATGLGEILNKTLTLSVTNADTGVFDATASYPLVLNRISCPAGTCIVGTYYNMNRAILSNANLANIDLTGATLTNAIFTGANLTNTTFAKTLIQNASFVNATSGPGVNDFTGAYLSTVNFSGATLYPVWTAANTKGLTGFNASQMHTSGVVYNGILVAAGMTITGANLSGFNANCVANGINLMNTQFISDDLSSANFQGCDLTSAYFGSDTLTDANFSYAIMQRVSSLSNVGTPSAMPNDFAVRYGFIFGPRVTIQGKNLVNADLSNLNLTGICFINTDLSGANFTNSILTNATIEQRLSSGQVVANPGLVAGADFTNANIAGLVGLRTSSAYVGNATYLYVTGGSPAAMSSYVKFDAVNGRLIILA